GAGPVQSPGPTPIPNKHDSPGCMTRQVSKGPHVTVRTQHWNPPAGGGGVVVVVGGGGQPFSTGFVAEKKKGPTFVISLSGPYCTQERWPAPGGSPSLGVMKAWVP